MKKKLLSILLPVFTFACLFLLASCDAYGGNYKEVKDEELNAVETKLNSIAFEEEASKNTNYERNITATVKMEVSGGVNEATITTKQLYDRSDESSNTQATYSKYEVRISGKSENMTISTETWTLTDGMVYFKASMNGSAEGKSYNTSMAKKGTSKAVFSGNLDYIAIQAAMSSFTSALNETNSSIDLSYIIESLNENNVKVYTSGDNKIKVESNQNGSLLTFFLIINSDNTYQMKFVMPETDFGGKLGGISISETMEVKPTSQKVTAPSGNFEEA